MIGNTSVLAITPAIAPAIAPFPQSSEKKMLWAIAEIIGKATQGEYYDHNSRQHRLLLLNYTPANFVKDAFERLNGKFPNKKKIRQNRLRLLKDCSDIAACAGKGALMVLDYFNKKIVEHSLENWCNKVRGRGEREKRVLAKERIIQWFDNNEDWDLSSLGLSSLPDIFHRMPNKFIKLNLANNRLKELPPHLNLNMIGLNINNNNFEVLPEQIQSSRFLKSLEFSNNQLKSLPEWLINMGFLEEVNAESNQLKELPTQLPPNLNNFKIARNKFEILPPQIQSLKNLRCLDCSFNQLKSLPELGSLGCLEHIDAGNNQLESLPDALPPRMKIINFAKNAIKQIPLSYGTLRDLCQLNFCDNDIEDVPDEIYLLMLKKVQGQPVLRLEGNLKKK